MHTKKTIVISGDERAQKNVDVFMGFLGRSAKKYGLTVTVEPNDPQPSRNKSKGGEEEE